MKLEMSMIEQLKGIFSALENNYTLNLYAEKSSDKGAELIQMVEDFASTSDKFSVNHIEDSRLRLEILREEEPTGIIFRGIPGGHEFTSLILAVYNADGKGKNFPDEAIINRIKSLKGEAKLKTYISLSCTNCPDVVQSLNLVALLSEGRIQHQMVDGAVYKEEVEALNIASVPAAYIGEEILHIGKSNLGELLGKLEEKLGKDTSNIKAVRKEYDLVVVGGGPAGVTSAIYSARKGLKVALLADRIGGQVNETTAIENIPSVAQTTGTQLAADLKLHAEEYAIDIYEQRLVESIELLDGNMKAVHSSMKEEFIAPQVILSTGAAWRKLNVKGEEDYIGRGVAFCPHCDGPFFKGKDIAVVGGGNSGVEAAIDLAGICNKVTVLEFADTLKADIVLQEKLNSLANVEVHKSVATQEVLGDGAKVTGLLVAPRNGDAPFELALDGVFVQIGLAPNTAFVDGVVERNRMGEIVVDERCRTSVEGIYAAGDCSTVPYKQIVIAMGEGAKAALTAFDDRIRMGQ